MIVIIKEVRIEIPDGPDGCENIESVAIGRDGTIMRFSRNSEPFLTRTGQWEVRRGHKQYCHLLNPEETLTEVNQ